MQKTEEQTRFEALLRGLDSLTPQAREQVAKFRDLVIDENTRQNLTRLTSPEQFYEGHVLDCIEIGRLGELGTLMDLGSGAGVPGLLSAAMGNPGSWILAESEGKKAEFLKVAVEQLGLGDRVEVFAGRAEEFLKKRRVDGIVARAVGPVGRIFRWIQECSTWNKLILLKGPGWDEEWAEFQTTGDRKKLAVEQDLHYEVGVDRKKRRLLVLARSGPK